MKILSLKYHRSFIPVGCKDIQRLSFIGKKWKQINIYIRILKKNPLQTQNILFSRFTEYARVHCNFILQSILDIYKLSSLSKIFSERFKKYRCEYRRVPVKMGQFKGSDRQYMVVELNMQYCEQYFQESLETQRLLCDVYLLSLFTFKIIFLGEYVLRIVFLIIK